MSVGVGSGIQFNELQSIADKPEYVFTMNSFDELVAAVGSFSWEVCDIVNKLTFSPTQAPSTSIPTMTPSAMPTTTSPTNLPTPNPVTSVPSKSPSLAPSTAPSPSPTSSPTSGPTTSPTDEPSTPPTVECVVSKHLDLAFVVDGSGSIQQNGFDLSRQFVSEVLDRFTVSSSDTRIGIVQFSSSAQAEVTFSGGESAAFVHNALDSMNWMNGGTQTSNGILYTKDNLFINARPDAAKVMIVLTDGASGDNSQVGANLARAEGITMMSVGVGSGIQFNELQSIADKPEYVFTMNSFDELVAAVGSFSWEVCDIVNKLTFSPTQAPSASIPSKSPSLAPSTAPSSSPTNSPTTTSPTDEPSTPPTVECVVSKPLDLAL